MQFINFQRGDNLTFVNIRFISIVNFVGNKVFIFLENDSETEYVLTEKDLISPATFESLKELLLSN